MMSKSFRQGACAKGYARAAGFTLVELMIVVAIIGILAAIAYPSYQNQVRQSRRAQAKADLVEYAQLAERFITINGALSANGTTFTLPNQRSPREASAFLAYNLQLQITGQRAFQIRAIPQGGQAADTCGTLSLSGVGVKEPATSGCW